MGFPTCTMCLTKERKQNVDHNFVKNKIIIREWINNFFLNLTLWSVHILPEFQMWTSPISSFRFQAQSWSSPVPETSHHCDKRYESRCNAKHLGTSSPLQTLLSDTSLQTLPELITSLSPCICPLMLPAPSERSGY